MKDLKTLKKELEAAVKKYERPEFIKDDPISFPHRFTKKADIEIAALFASTIAWGNRQAILKSLEKLNAIFENQPYEFITKAEDKDFEEIKTFYHRTFNGEDAFGFASALRYLYLEEKVVSLEELFKAETACEPLEQRSHRFKTKFCSLLPIRSSKHIGSMITGSAAKKVNMFLRWMVRPASRGVDFGLWKSILPSELYLPLDVHSARISRELGLLTRNANDAKAVQEVTANLRSLCPEDPVKYDFALFAVGVNR